MRSSSLTFDIGDAKRVGTCKILHPTPNQFGGVSVMD